ncbi:calcium-binding protein [Tropicibacter naphthalenivorans]|uniref:Poly(Beta-D-mannuronate) C5 epimerase 7 n=1 Tax=Tropicibacter naphthalenivorans TaxID=441103 RepID=A0A0P1GB44_9RHOB|nr:calcium-binding protein [Tropicibacter naphthalenivorans]CUH78696.1 Poly(beta-D-mannuronate) C5 epimerase 7 [Tropicibacter naphthalenivorans]SMC81261.1 Hemolysin-type calcium-binding repeat-containing protein [Tropicibacter naphthalenivorans]
MANYLGDNNGNILSGTADADSIVGMGGNDQIYGLTGNDFLDGGADNDTLAGGVGNDTVAGDSGNDAIEIGLGDDYIDAGDGVDTMYVGYYDNLQGQGAVSINMNATGAQATGGAGTDTLLNFENFTYFNLDGLRVVGTPGDNRFSSLNTTSDDKIFGLGGNDYALLGGGNDTMLGGDGQDTMHGGDGNDRLYGGGLSDQVYGGNGNDFVDGGAHHDLVRGDAGNDVLRGGTGIDALEGGAGRDIMWGGDGAGADFAKDSFVFTDTSESGLGAARDVIRDFEQGYDVVHLSNIDADIATSGDQAFTLIGNAQFSGTAGELRAVVHGSNTLLKMDVDGDGSSDMDILLNGAFTLTADDFVL